MPGGYPIAGTGETCNWNAIGYVRASDENATVIYCGAVANAKGAWTQLTGSSGTPADCCLLTVMIFGASANGASAFGDFCSIDIGIGPGGSQVVLIADLPLIWQSAGSEIPIPVSIPKGTQIWARGQSTGTADYICAAVKVADGSFAAGEGFCGCDTVGFIPAATTGTSVTYGANAKGSYSVITPTGGTRRDYAGICIGGQPTYASTAGGQFTADIAIGGTGSEKIIIPDVSFMAVFNYTTTFLSSFLPVQIPQGTTISVRGVHNTGSTFVMYHTIHGFY